ncbi:prepilin-type N-terminal cleavage/methylation domain-containing protein [Thermodesulfobacteriota bacterium]
MIAKQQPKNGGFTLVELLVTMAISGIVMGGIYQVYNANQRTYIVQREIVEMQQNLRASIFLLGRELRMAGFDPTGEADASIVTATSGSVRFTMDTSEDEDVLDSGEDITYSLYDSGSDGDNDLGRKVGAGSNQPVALNIDALNFVYFDAGGSILACTAVSPVANPENIRSVQVTIVARSGFDFNYTNANVYRNDQDELILGAVGDHYRRRLLTTRVQCRNMGL